MSSRTNFMFSSESCVICTVGWFAYGIFCFPLQELPQLFSKHATSGITVPSLFTGCNQNLSGRTGYLIQRKGKKELFSNFTTNNLSYECTYKCVSNFNFIQEKLFYRFKVINFSVDPFFENERADRTSGKKDNFCFDSPGAGVKRKNVLFFR